MESLTYQPGFQASLVEVNLLHSILQMAGLGFNWDYVGKHLRNGF